MNSVIGRLYAVIRTRGSAWDTSCPLEDQDGWQSHAEFMDALHAEGFVVMAGPLFQPIRGIIFALALYPLRTILFEQRRGWLILWWLLLALGVLSTFGPAFGSVEGLIYTVIPPSTQIAGLWEVVLQSLLLSFILYHWVRGPRRRWLDWTLGTAFVVVLALPVLGLLTR